MAIKKVFIIGSGAMGSGLAQTAITAGYETVLRSRTVDAAVIEKNVAKLTKSFSKQVEKGKMTQEAMDVALAKFSMTSDLNDAKDAALVIEAAAENIEVKKDLFKQLDVICKPETILASNTSSLSITDIASVTKRPEQVIGMHFFNPVPVMKLLEVVRGLSSSEETVEIAVAFGKTLGKEIIVSKDSPAFIVNRMLDPMINEAISILEAGIGTVEDIDRGMRFGLNHPMGPLELIDMAGIDIELAVMEVLLAETGDPKYRPSFLLKNMVRAGLLGRKTGKGFYIYAADGSKEPNPELLSYLR